jgi:AbiV family abortive infection protein
MTPLTIDQIISGCEKISANARALISESDTLCKAVAFARAYALAHLAREECAKIPMLFKCGVLVILGQPVDWNKLEKRLRDHKSKISNDKATLVMFAELYAGGAPSVESAANAINALLADHPIMSQESLDHWNRRKNDSLYVGFDGNDFVEPSSQFTERQAWRTARLAEISLGQAHHIADSLRRWASDPQKAKEFWEPQIKTMQELGIERV